MLTNIKQAKWRSRRWSIGASPRSGINVRITNLITKLLFAFFDKLAGCHWMTEVQIDAQEVMTHETGLAEPCKAFTPMVAMAQFLHIREEAKGSSVKKDLW
jgi:hypothetical protein